MATRRSFRALVSVDDELGAASEGADITITALAAGVDVSVSRRLDVSDLLLVACVYFLSMSGLVVIGAAGGCARAWQ
jgi:hypothetical protein